MHQKGGSRQIPKNGLILEISAAAETRPSSKAGRDCDNSDDDDDGEDDDGDGNNTGDGDNVIVLSSRMLVSAVS